MEVPDGCEEPGEEEELSRGNGGVVYGGGAQDPTHRVHQTACQDDGRKSPGRSIRKEVAADRDQKK